MRCEGALRCRIQKPREASFVLLELLEMHMFLLATRITQFDESGMSRMAPLDAAGKRRACSMQPFGLSALMFVVGRCAFQ